MSFNQSVEFPLTQTDTCTLSGQLQTKNGTGAGGINLGWRHIFSHKSWAEVEVAAGIKHFFFKNFSIFKVYKFR